MDTDRGERRGYYVSERGGRWHLVTLDEIPGAGAGTRLLPGLEGDGLISDVNTMTAITIAHEMIVM